MHIVIKPQQATEYPPDSLTEWEIPLYDEDDIARLDRVATLFPPLSDEEKERLMDRVRQIHSIRNPIGAIE
jgi:hypothetical protein